MNKLTGNPFFTHIEAHDPFPFVVVAPLCTENTWFDLFERLKKLVKEIVAADFADPDRIYAIGASMGGYATWQLGMSLPNTFAAIVPICGGGMYWNAPRLKGVPVWAFHGEIDTTVRCEESVKMVEAINKKGGNAKLTIYEGVAHNSWTPTFEKPEVWAWMLEQRNHYVQTRTEFDDVKTYG